MKLNYGRKEEEELKLIKEKKSPERNGYNEGDCHLREEIEKARKERQKNNEKMQKRKVLRLCAKSKKKKGKCECRKWRGSRKMDRENREKTVMLNE